MPPSVAETRHHVESSRLRAADVTLAADQAEHPSARMFPSHARRVRVEQERSKAVVLRAVPKSNMQRFLSGGFGGGWARLISFFSKPPRKILAGLLVHE